MPAALPDTFEEDFPEATAVDLAVQTPVAAPAHGANGNGRAARDNSQHFTRPTSDQAHAVDQGEEAERAILGALLLDPASLLLIRDLLQPSDFCQAKHGAIYSAIAALADRAIWPDLITLTEELESRGVLERCGGRAEISRLTSAVPTSANVRYYVDLVREAAKRRGILRLASSLVEDVANPAADPEAIITRATAELARIQQPSARARGFKLVSVGGLEIKSPDFLIQGYIELDGLSDIFGDPGAGKSFLAVDWSCRVATGTSWNGLSVKQGPAVYVAGEGQNGITRRFRAWAIRNQVDLSKAPLFVALQPVRLIEPESVAEMIAAVEKIVSDAGAPALIVLDTLARNFGSGDENSSEDMSAAIGAADQLRARWHCAVLFTHHSGHTDKTRGRGHSSLRGALDSEFRLEKDADGVVRLEATKTKDCEPPASLSFRIRTVELGMQDVEGKPITSAVLDPIEWEEKPEAQGKAGSGKWQTAAMVALAAALETHRRNVEADGRDPAEARVSMDAWKVACQRAGIPAKRFFDVKRTLMEHGSIVEEYGHVRPR